MADLTLNPCAACVAQAAYSKLLLSTNSSDFTDSGGAKRLHFIGEDLKWHRSRRNDQGITGDLYKLKDRFHEGQNFIYGPVYFAMNAGDTETLLPHLIGPSDSGTGGSSLFLPDSCPTVFHLKILRDYGIWTFTDCYVSQFQITSRALQFREESLADMIVLAVNIIGTAVDFQTDESYWPTADEPTLGTGDAYAPYFYKHSRLHMLRDSGTTKNFSAYIKDVALQVNHNLQPRYRMSSTPTSVCSNGRDVQLDIGIDWNATTKELRDQSTNQPGFIKFAMDESATYWTRFDFGALVAVDRDPVSKAKDEEVEWSIRNIAAADDIDSDEYDIWATNKAS